MRKTGFLLLAVLACATARAVPPDILPPEKAFLVEARADGAEIVLDWTVAPDHYLYKKRFSFASDTPGVELGPAVFPAGELHNDEFFGESTIYRDRFAIRLPASGYTPGAPVTLTIGAQGCNEAIGLCFPPQRWTREVRLAAVSGGPAGAGAAGAGQDFLPPDEAFRLAAERLPDGSLDVVWDIAPDYYLYRHRLAFEVDGNPVTETVTIPAGKPKTDEFFGDVEVYYDRLAVNVPGPPAGPVSLSVGYQGCAEGGLCYPPMRRDAILDPGALVFLTGGSDEGSSRGTGVNPFLLATGGSPPDAAADAGAPVTATSAPGASGSAAGPVTAPPVPEEERLAGVIASGSILTVAGLFFGLGLLLAFTPCVLPMVPILSGLIIGQGDRATPRRSFMLSLVYVMAMALTYTVAGVIVALLGHNLQAAFQHPAVIITFSAVFVALALAMFGAWDFQMPAAIQTRLTEISNRQSGGNLAGAGVMGILSALIVGPCVAAPLAAALIVIGQSGDPLRGGLALFALSMGMGAPLLAFGASAGKLLPKAGAWMDAVKAFFGLLLLGVAIWMLERILPPSVTLALWAALLFVGAVLLGALSPLDPGAGMGRRFAKGAGLLGMAYGLVLLVGAASGGADPLRPLAHLVSGTGAAGGAASVSFLYVKGSDGLDEQLARAAAEGRPVMLDFYADWCVDCKRMDRYTFPDPAVAAALAPAIVLKTDVTPNDAEDRALMDRFGLFGPPATLFFTPSGTELKGFRKLGYTPPAEFAAHVRAAFTEAAQTTALAREN
jgi:thiol:disulfide interchange protein DsbD